MFCLVNLDDVVSVICDVVGYDENIDLRCCRWRFVSVFL